jgi:hypothetical protein
VDRRDCIHPVGVQRGALLNAKAALERLGCSGAELEVTVPYAMHR